MRISSFAIGAAALFVLPISFFLAAPQQNASVSNHKPPPGIPQQGQYSTSPVSADGQQMKANTPIITKGKADTQSPAVFDNTTQASRSNGPEKNGYMGAVINSHIQADSKSTDSISATDCTKQHGKTAVQSGRDVCMLVVGGYKKYYYISFKRN